MKITAVIVITLWVFSTCAQFATAAILIKRGLFWRWVLAVAGLSINAGKSVVLMAIWWGLGFREYGVAWQSTRWIHWVAVALLCLQVLWALSRVWPQGKPFAVMLASFLVAVAGSAAALQSGWIVWPGWVGASVVASRSFSLAALMVAFWGGWIYRCLQVTTRNAGLWNTGLQAALCVEIVCLAVEAWVQRGVGMVAAQIAKQTAYMLACWWWWRMTPDGDSFTLPAASDMPELAWRVIRRRLEKQNPRMVSPGVWD